MREMREILFRGQTRRYGEKVRMGNGEKLPSRWVYGGVLQGIGSYSIIYGGENANDPGENLSKWCVYTDTLDQFVGFTDRNGVKVFEGDIVARSGKRYVIAWDPRRLCFCAVSKQNEWHPLSLTHDPVTDLAVIGNMHDSPWLLQGGIEDDAELVAQGE